MVYGFISPEWPLTQLSVGLTGETRADIELQVTNVTAGRMMVSGAYYICLQYGSEIFPTVIRGQVRDATKLLSIVIMSLSLVSGRGADGDSWRDRHFHLAPGRLSGEWSFCNTHDLLAGALPRLGYYYCLRKLVL